MSARVASRFAAASMLMFTAAASLPLLVWPHDGDPVVEVVALLVGAVLATAGSVSAVGAAVVRRLDG